MVGVLLNNPNKAEDKEQLVGAESSDVLVTVVVSDATRSAFCHFDANVALL